MGYNPSEAELAWLAGLFDGEGCLSIDRPTYDPYTRFRMRIVLQERDGFVLDHVQRLVGGYRLHRNRQQSWRDNCSEQEEWGVRKRAENLRVARLLLPYLVLKHEACTDFIVAMESYESRVA